MSFSIVTKLSNDDHNHFQNITPQTNPVPICSHSPCFPYPPPQKSLLYFLSPRICLLWECPINTHSPHVFVISPNVLPASHVRAHPRWPTVPAADPGCLWVSEVTFSPGSRHDSSGHMTARLHCFRGCSQAGWGAMDKTNFWTELEVLGPGC